MDQFIRQLQEAAREADRAKPRSTADRHLKNALELLIAALQSALLPLEVEEEAPEPVVITARA